MVTTGQNIVGHSGGGDQQTNVQHTYGEQGPMQESRDLQTPVQQPFGRVEIREKLSTIRNEANQGPNNFVSSLLFIYKLTYGQLINLLQYQIHTTIILCSNRWQGTGKQLWSILKGLGQCFMENQAPVPVGSLIVGEADGVMRDLPLWEET